MPADDQVQAKFIRAIEKDGWIVEQEQIHLFIGGRNLWIDLRARHPSNDEIILIEVKTYGNISSPVSTLQSIIGQYLMYRSAIRHHGSNLPLFLAVPIEAWETIFQEELGQLLITDFNIKLVVFDPIREDIILWKP